MKLKNIAAVIMILCIAVSGCSPKPAQETTASEASKPVESPDGEPELKEYTITYWHHDASSDIVAALEKVIADFETENPNIKIDMLALPADGFYQKYVSAVATNTAPDIFGTRDTEMLALVGQDALLPLDGYIAEWDCREEIPESIWKSVAGFTGDGKTYMIPSYMNACCMWYNTKLMEERNEKIPGTLEEFLEDCKKYADPAGNSYFYTLRGGAGCYDNLFIFLMTYAGGTGFFDENGECVLSQDIYAEALDKYAEIYKNGWVSRDSITNAAKEMMAEFGSGTAMCFSHNSASVTTNQANLGDGAFINAIHPAGANGKTAIPTPNLIGAAVTTQSEHPDIAVKFVEYLAEHGPSSYFCQNAGKTPINNLIYEQDDWCKNDPYMPLYQEIMSSEDVVLYSNPIWLEEWTSMINNDIVSDLQAVLMGEKDSKTVLEGWAETLTAGQQAYLKSR